MTNIGAKSGSPKNLFYASIVASIALAVISYFTNTNHSLSDYKHINAPLEKIEITQVKEKTHGNTSQSHAVSVLSFSVRGVSSPFGIKRSSQDYADLLNNLKVGDEIKVYYEDGPLTEEGINFYVAQLEKEGRALVDLKSADAYYKKIKYSFALASVILLGFAIWWYQAKIKVS